MRILVVNYEFPPLGGGSSPLTYELAKSYVKLGHQVDVVSMAYKGLPVFEQKDGINISRVKCLRSRKDICYPYEQLTFIISAIWFLRKHLRSHSYDVNHTHFFIPSGIISVWLKRKFGLPYVITSHGSDVPGFNPDRFKFLHRFTGPLLRYICRHAETVVSPSCFLAGLIKERIGSVKTTVIPNGVDPDKYLPSEKKNIILSTGRLLHRKGFHHLISAVSTKNFGYEVHIAGDGPMMKTLSGLAKRSATRIVLHGWMNNNSKEYKNLLAAATIFVLASEKENASVALLEAMSAGCAVITTKVSGCPETVGKAGIVVDPGNPHQLANAIMTLINDRALLEEKARQSRERILQKFSWDMIIKKYLEVLESKRV